jgi:hypothetical protein
MAEDKKPMIGDPESNAAFNASVDALLAKAGVPPLSNPDRVKAPPVKESHETTQRVTGTAKSGLFQHVVQSAPYKYEYTADMHAGRRAPWVGVLGTAQEAGHEVSVHLREDPAVSIARGKIVNDPALSNLDEIGIAAMRTVKIERDTGSAPRREVTTVLLEDIAAVTVIEKKS